MRRVDWNNFPYFFSFRGWVTPRMRRVDWNSCCFCVYRNNDLSRLAWGVWIEMSHTDKFAVYVAVTPRMRRVDWNIAPLVKVKDVTSHASHEACGLKSFLACLMCLANSHASHEACWLKSLGFPDTSTEISHASHEACGLKWLRYSKQTWRLSSRLAWGVWIEIGVWTVFSVHSVGHASHEACGLKSPPNLYSLTQSHVTPRMRRVDWNRHR